MSNLHGDLARAIVHEPSDEWPDYIEIRAYWGPPNGKHRGRHKSTLISADEFFGRGGYGAPMTGDQLINRIERLRKG